LKDLRITAESLEITKEIAAKIDGDTFHHHFHVLSDIASLHAANQSLTYVEIGCYAGASACLMLQRPLTKVVSIDIGKPVSPKTPIANAEKLNPHDNDYQYIKGNSQSRWTVRKLKKIIDEIDILFIDGDHSYEGVRKDFLLYHKLVKRDGYIIFDDYKDHEFSPEVKPSVDDIIAEFAASYEVIGCLENKHNARPESLTDNNCFIIRKNL
jgi:predicted O-methyltransferase YrrM